MVSSGINLTVVPVLLVVPTFFKSESKCPPFLNEISYLPPSRHILTFIHLESALTTDAPTPWRPPDTLYPPSWNLPPAWSTVYITSGVDLPDACLPTGTPRPSSDTETEPSLWIITVRQLPYPLIASSIPLSTISHTRWCKPLLSVEPMYIPGLFLTASRPSNILIDDSSYFAIKNHLLIFFNL